MVEALRSSFAHYAADPKTNNTVPCQVGERFDGESLINRGTRLSPWEPSRFLLHANTEIDSDHGSERYIIASVGDGSRGRRSTATYEVEHRHHAPLDAVISQAACGCLKRARRRLGWSRASVAISPVPVTTAGQGVTERHTEDVVGRQDGAAHSAGDLGSPDSLAVADRHLRDSCAAPG